MTPASSKRPQKKIYLDSSVVIAFLKGEEGRCDIATDILKAAERGDLQIFTSTFTVAEVCKAGTGAGLTAKESDKAIDFFGYDFIILVDLDRRTAEEAHLCVSRYGLRPGDAVHLASALRAGCEVLWAWDDQLTGADARVQQDHSDIKIEEPRRVNAQGELF